VRPTFGGVRRDPFERFTSADELLAALEAVSRAGRELVIPEGIGRGVEVRAVLERLRAGALVVVAGDSGVGKLARLFHMSEEAVGAMLATGAEGREFLVRCPARARYPARAMTGAPDSSEAVGTPRGVVGCTWGDFVAQLVSEHGSLAALALRLAELARSIARPATWRGALALYERLPSGEVHPFVGYRRDAGLAHGYDKLGEHEKALALARAALEHAADGGYVRLRVMGLGLLARILGDEAGAAARARALAIAGRLEDEELLGRVERIGHPRSGGV